MPTRVLLLRHAETANPLIFHGAESDVGLSARGLCQAEAVAPVLAQAAPTRLFSSGMLRARQTAEPIARACRLPVRIVPELHERRVGQMCGQPTRGHAVWHATLKRWLAGQTGYAAAAAESYDDMCRRILPVWERLTGEHAGETLVVVAHGMVCKVLLIELLPDYSLADWRRLGPIHNVGIHELVEDNGVWQALRLNEVPGPARDL
jgi:broad specificity phosphatase PhoE